MDTEINQIIYDCFLIFCISGRPVRNPQHPDYVPSVFSFSPIADRLSKKRKICFETASVVENSFEDGLADKVTQVSIDLPNGEGSITIEDAQEEVVIMCEY